MADLESRLHDVLGDVGGHTEPSPDLFGRVVGSSAGEMCVCALTDPVGLSQPTISHHMKLLVEAGLVTREQRGKWAYYQPTTGTLADAAKALLG